MLMRTQLSLLIDVEGNLLTEHSDLFKQLGFDILIPIEKKSFEKPFINARIFYVFEDSKGRKLFDVSMWGKERSVFVNGVEFRENDIFYDIIIPFLPTDIASDLEYYLGSNLLHE